MTGVERSDDGEWKKALGDASQDPCGIAVEGDLRGYQGPVGVGFAGSLEEKT